MRFLVVVAALVGCYSPSVRDCTVTCASANDCTGGQVCAGGWCAAPEMSCEGVAPDAVTPSDGSDGTAQALCVLGCTNGTCDAGVCVIDCSAADTCSSDIVCPPNIPCRVRCGDRSCDKKIMCSNAASCEVQCVGADSCSDDIICNDRPCDVDCSGSGSCKVTKCKSSCSCDVTCGTGACEALSECPLGDACRLGRGCSSELAGCDRCE